MSDLKTRLIELLQYIEELARLTPGARRQAYSVRTYREFSMFEHQLRGRVGVTLDTDDGDAPVWIRLDRLHREEPPAPPVGIADWLEVADDPTTAPEPAAMRLAQLTQAEADRLVRQGQIEDDDLAPAADDPDLLQAHLQLARFPTDQAELESYLAGPWRDWSTRELPRRETIRIYEKLFRAVQSIDAGGADVPLEFVVGVGLALWKSDGRTVEHPLVELPVETIIDPDSHALLVRPREAEPQLYLKPFLDLDVQGADRFEQEAIAWLAAQAENEDEEAIELTPFSLEPLAPLLKKAAAQLASSGAYLVDYADPQGGRTPPEISARLTILDTWALYARPQTGNFVVQDLHRLQQVVADTDEADLPPSGRSLVSPPSEEQAFDVDFDLLGGFDPAAETPDEETAGSEPRPLSPDEIYFPKASNEAQVEIIQRLHTRDGVVVQGPPGTGKTHTIANIVCHYLATGRSVLVVSKGESALQVLREQIPAAVRDLTISLLTTERNGLKQLEQAVTFIADDIVSKDHKQIKRDLVRKTQEVRRLREERNSLDAAIVELARRQLEAVDADLAGAPDRMPAELAVQVAAERRQHAWLTDPVVEAPEVTDEQITAARTARQNLGEDLAYLDRRLPRVQELPTAATIDAVHRDLLRASQIERQVAQDNTPVLSTRPDNAILRAEELRQNLRQWAETQTLLAETPWLERLFEVWREGSAEQGALDALLEAMQEAAKTRAHFLRQPVQIPEAGEHRPELLHAVERAQQGKAAIPAWAFWRGRDQAMLDQIRVNGRPPKSALDWEQVKQYADYQECLTACAARWNNLAADFRLPSAPADQAEIQAWLGRTLPWLVDVQKTATTFEKDVLQQTTLLFPQGFSPAQLATRDGVRAAIQAVETNLARVKLSSARSSIEQGLETLSRSTGPIVEQMQEFLRTSVGDESIEEAELGDAWRSLLRELARLHEQRGPLDTVDSAAQQVQASGAPLWADRLRETPATLEADPVTPLDWQASWRMKRLETRLVALDSREQLTQLSAERLQTEQDLSKAMLEVVRLRTYLGLFERMTKARLSALTTFVTAVRKIGAGTGIRARRFRGDARKAMLQCMEAVPCWIMPTWRVSESLPARLGGFDLVIVDEASQSDARALPALLRAKKTLIVGDDRQVSPEAVAVEERKVNQLRRRFLQGQPFASQLAPGGSLYDLASAVFPGDKIMLNEHFRCVEPIIRFSFQFYSKEIHALRIPKASERIDPPLVDVYLPHGERDAHKVNLAEVEAIVDEIELLTKDPAFQNRSMGVISLIGDQQAELIQNRLLERIGEDKYVQHRIACGNAAAFQGKERDIMFLSMVASRAQCRAQTGWLYDQRFNVALSRARDRMYLYRSVQPEDLSSPRDLKRKVIEHFLHPMPQAPDASQSLIERCETPLERDFFRHLTKLGYRATPHVEVGRFRIDLVVEGENDRRLAIELDGDTRQTADAWLEDWNRQKVLERAGWRFWRCWAASYALDPKACLADLTRTLAAAEIRPLGAASAPRAYTEHRVLLPEMPAREGAKRDPAEPERDEEQPTPGLPTPPQRSVQIGDRVVVSFEDDPARHYTLLLTADIFDQLGGLVSAGDPSGAGLLAAEVDDQVELTWNGETRKATILQIEQSTLV
ncbi:AAA domain-containing protein [Lignipirellula cremea]|uniref:Uncharacterized protein n=1 Tax=Lignipirellula cremea TaxID=2528010 RepID=A0A518DPG5_9BACT|nr:AAA domain-containing protein [Lignipirellula cremea]QDU93735.1 hypothetical protein Pla8534_15180 [Lignipirellula cremea]